MTVSRRVAILGFLVFSASCDYTERPAAPSPVPLPPATILPSPTSGPPPATGAATTYVFDGQLSYPIRAYTAGSKYELYQNGRFSLQYASLSGEYAGTYLQENDAIVFSFAGDSRWGAVGTVRGDSLEVRYNEIMEHSDFENAVYRRSQP
jgi:hypothetical protein